MSRDKRADTNHKKLWDSLEEIERIVLLYLVHTSAPTSLDAVIALTGISAVGAVNVMEGLKERGLVHEKKGHGRGIYFIKAGGFADSALRLTGDDERRNILTKIADYYSNHHDDCDEKTLALAQLYYQLGDPEGGTRHIKDAAHILYRSDQKEKAVAYHDYLLKDFYKKGISKDNIKDFLDTILDKVGITMASMPTQEAIPLLKKALSAARHYRMQDRLIRIKIALLYKLHAAGNNDAVRRHMEDLRKQSSTIKDPVIIEMAGLAICDILGRKGRFREAIRQYEEIAKVLPEDQHDEINLIAIASIGNKYVLCGDMPKGMGMIQAIRERALALNLPDVVAHADMMRLYSLMEIRQTEQARACLDTLHKVIKNEPENLHMSIGIGLAEAYICYAMGDYEGALALYKEIEGHFISAGIEKLLWGWGLEFLFCLDEKGLLGDASSIDSEIDGMLRLDNIYRKGVALKYRAMQAIRKNGPLDRISADLETSEGYLEDAGAEIELARERIIAANLFMEKGDIKTGQAYLDRAFRSISRLDKKLFPADLLVTLPLEAKIGILTRRIMDIGRSPGAEGPLYLERMLHIIMDFSAATRGAFLRIDKAGFRFIIAKNMDEDIFIQGQPCRDEITAAAANGREIIIPFMGNPVTEGQSFPINALIGIPVILQEGGPVYLILANPLGGGCFPDSALPFSRLICSQTALGLANMRLSKEIMGMKERLEPDFPNSREVRIDTPIEMIIGRSFEIKKVKDQVRQVAATDSAVLIMGETGVGKELAARAIHKLSSRRNGPFISVNIAALPQELAAAELFGHEKGAFTGAYLQNKGRFELADRGTIFLDEIGDLSIQLQVKLLRVLQEGTFERLGSSKPIVSDFRVIAATNKDLYGEIKKGTFREDLYYRLNVFPIVMPPVRDRKGDIPLLARYFIDSFAKRMGKRVKVSSLELKRLNGYIWPGNVRELKHFLEKAVILYDEKGLDLSVQARPPVQTPSGRDDLLSSLSDMEKAHIIKVLNATGGRVKGPEGAAAILGIIPSTLYYRMKKLNINRLSYLTLKNPLT
jgi:transcriptional regulator with GAF, ATPase, and Fis domain/tetratricopeptide (TPR) repeat protein